MPGGAALHAAAGAARPGLSGWAIVRARICRGHPAPPKARADAVAEDEDAYLVRLDGAGVDGEEVWRVSCAMLNSGFPFGEWAWKRAGQGSWELSPVMSMDTGVV